MEAALICIGFVALMFLIRAVAIGINRQSRNSVHRAMLRRDRRDRDLGGQTDRRRVSDQRKWAQPEEDDADW